MANTQKLVLKDPKKSLSKDIGSKITMKEVVKYNAQYEDAEIVIEDEGRQTDPYSPVNIKVVQLLNKKKKATSADTTLTGVVISFAKPSDWSATLEYQARLYNKEFRKFDAAIALKNIPIDDGKTNSEYDLKDCSSEFAYYFLAKEMAITAAQYKDNYLVQVQRKVQENWSEWGTELHTNFTIGGKATIFKTEVDLSYSSGDENVGLKPGQEFKVKYADILEEEFAKSLPKRIFTDKPETSLLGISVRVSKFNYNTRNKNFNLAVNLNTGDIDVATDPKMLDFYKISYEKSDATTVPDADKTAITNLNKKGIQLLPGVHIKEVYFEVNITDEAPAEAKK